MLQQKRSVQFRSIEILEFAYTVGDNPSVRSGVPLSMEWIHQMKTVIPLCFFESHRPPRSRGECGPRRLSSRHREKVLLRNGCSIQDMTTAARDALRIQEERAFTSYQLQTQKLMRSRRKREIHQGPPAEVTAPPSRISIEAIRKIPSADKSPVLPKRDALRIQKERSFTSYQLQTQKLMRSRRKREINEGPAEVTAPPPSRISIEAIRKKPPADRSPVLPQRFPSSPVTVSPRAADKEKLYARLSPMMLQRPCLTRLIARSAVHC
jgi:hypothetical protein